MKKNRPGVLLRVISPNGIAFQLSRIILEESTSIGLRLHEVERVCLARKTVSVQTKFGKVRMKVSESDGHVVNVMPEYEDCKKIARREKIPLKHTYQKALSTYYASNPFH